MPNMLSSSANSRANNCDATSMPVEEEISGVGRRWSPSSHPALKRSGLHPLKQPTPLHPYAAHTGTLQPATWHHQPSSKELQTRGLTIYGGWGRGGVSSPAAAKPKTLDAMDEARGEGQVEQVEHDGTQREQHLQQMSAAAEEAARAAPHVRHAARGGDEAAVRCRG